MDRRLPLMLVCASLAAVPASAQSNAFDIGVLFGADVQRADRGAGLRGGIQAALAIDDRFDFYPGLTFSGDQQALLRPLLAVRAWPLGRPERSAVGWYLGGGVLSDQATFLTGLQLRVGGIQPFLQAQFVSPEGMDLLLGLSVRVK